MTAKLEQTITVNVDGEDREILMSFGLLNELTALVADPGFVPRIMTDVDLRESILISALSERSKTGKITKELEDITDVDISMVDFERVLTWVMDHVMSFFIRSTQTIVRVTKQHKDTMEALGSSLDG